MGKELGEIKARSKDHHTIVSAIHAAYKPDASYIKRIKSKRLFGDAFEVVEEQDDPQAYD